MCGVNAHRPASYVIWRNFVAATDGNSADQDPRDFAIAGFRGCTGRYLQESRHPAPCLDGVPRAPSPSSEKCRHVVQLAATASLHLILSAPWKAPSREAKNPW